MAIVFRPRSASWGSIVRVSSKADCSGRRGVDRFIGGCGRVCGIAQAAWSPQVLPDRRARSRRPGANDHYGFGSLSCIE
jgi:hypothetical protein